MAKTVLTLDEKQVTRIQQIIIDLDKDEALKLIKEIDKKIKQSNPGCDPITQRIRDNLDNLK